jgi:hypothetical protein
MAELGNPFFGHAVMTPEVTAVCDRDPQVIDSSVVKID